MTVTVNSASGTTKYIPGKIEAESYDAHQGGMYAVATSDAGGGQQVIGITPNSWMDYNVVVTQSGNYNVSFRVATPQLHAQFQIKLGNTVLGTINIPYTGEWNAWTTVTLTNVPLTAGPQTLRILSTGTETCNFNWMEYALAPAPRGIGTGESQLIVDKNLPKPPTGLSVSVFPNPTEAHFNLKIKSKSSDLVQVKVYDILGRQVQYLQGTPGEVLRLGSALKAGAYLIETRQGDEKIVTKVVKQ